MRKFNDLFIVEFPRGKVIAYGGNEVTGGEGIPWYDDNRDIVKQVIQRHFVLVE
jgi:hypothetical protein